MSKGWTVKVDTQVVFNVDTNVGVLAETEEQAGRVAKEIVYSSLDYDDFYSELEIALPWDLNMGGFDWSRGSRSGDIYFDSIHAVSVEPDTDFDPDDDDDDEVKEDAAVVRDLMEAAQCLNEAYYSTPEDHPLREWQERYGIAEVRDQLNLCAIYCDQLHRLMMDEQGYDSCFDFDFVPQFLENCVDHETFKPKSEDMRVLSMYFSRIGA